ncbi:MAG: tyrosine-type recombinase/integrase [Caulobacterales bacterium]
MAKSSEPSRVARISKTVVDDAVAESERFALWDSELRGFGVRISPEGSKTYVVRYRVGGGRRGLQRQMVLGRHGTLTAEEARKRAKIALGQTADGKDPQGAKSAARAEMSVAELCDQYLKEGVAAKKQSTLKLDRIRIERHIKPGIGRLRISDVTRRAVERLMRDIASGTIRGDATPYTRGGAAAAARTIGLLGAIFSFAADRGIRPDNPTRGVKRPVDRRRERFLSGAELERLSNVMAAMADEARKGGRQEGAIVTEQHRQILTLLLLTGARKNEIVGLCWSEVDATGGLLRLRDSKTGARTISLGAGAAASLALVPRGDSPLVFPDPRDPGRPVRNLDWAWVTIRRQAGLPDVRIHDLRHTFASIGLMGGLSLAFIGKLLGHKHAATTQRYAHLADDPVRAAADRVSAAIAAQMTRNPGDIEPLGGTASG